MAQKNRLNNFDLKAVVEGLLPYGFKYYPYLFTACPTTAYLF